MVSEVGYSLLVHRYMCDLQRKFAHQAGEQPHFSSTPKTTNMAELAGLPIPHMDWSSSDTPQALRKFKNLCQLYFSGPLKEKSEEGQMFLTDLVRRGRERTGLHVDTIGRREEEPQHILDKI